VSEGSADRVDVVEVSADAEVAACRGARGDASYARLVLLLALFSPPLAAKLAPAFVSIACVGVLGGWLASRRE